MESIQQALTVIAVLALFGCTLYWLRTKDMVRFPGKGFRSGAARRMETVERLSLTPQHSLHMVRVGERVLLVAVSPGGCSLLAGKGWEEVER
jgi:flagellar biogenesis protein FliO